MNDRIDTSPEAINELLHRVMPGPWSLWLDERRNEAALIGCDYVIANCLWRYPGAESTAHFIARARDLVPALAEERDSLRAQYEAAAQRAETLESMVAAAFEMAAEAAFESDSLELATHGANKIAERIRAITPHDAAAALEARDRRMRNEGRRQVKVKPLVWKESWLRNDNALAYAVGSHGDSYEIIPDGAWFRLYVSGKRVGGAIASLEDAKASGNQYNADAILASLEPEDV